MDSVDCGPQAGTVFQERYGRHVTQARDELTAAAGEAAKRIADLLRDNKLRGSGSYPLAEVNRELAAQQEALAAAIEAFPLALAVDVDHRPDKFGAELATLMADLTRWLVVYRNLTDFPAVLRSQAHRDLEGLRGSANSVVAVLS